MKTNIFKKSKAVRITAIVLAVALFFCTYLFGLIFLYSTIFGGGREMAEIDEECYVNRSMKLNYSQSDYDDLTKSLDIMLSAAKNEDCSDVKYLITAIKMSTQLYELADAVALAQVYYYSNVSNQETYAIYSDLNAKFNVARNSYKALLEPTYHSIYRETFFGDMSNEEIEELIAKSVVSDELVALNNRITDIQSRFNALTDEQIAGEAFDGLFAELIDTENEIATYNGFDGYMNYCYPELYGRDYTPSDAMDFATSLSSKFVGAAENAKNRSESAANNLSQTDLSAYNNLFNSGYFASKENKALLDGFYKSMGDEIYSLYKQFMKKGYYYIASSDNAYQGAYTSYFYSEDTPYMYFSLSYATPITFVHEFGHYCNMYLSEEDGMSYDLAETHSQGAEWLFISYLKDHFSQKAYSYVVNSYFYEATASIFLCSLVGSFEINAYRADRTAEGFSFDGIMNAVAESNIGNIKYDELFPDFMNPAEYYRYVVINAPGYYMSYSVSLISALQFYALAKTNFESAVKSYQQLLHYSENYQESLRAVELESPFNALTVKNICDAFAEV